MKLFKICLLLLIIKFSSVSVKADDFEEEDYTYSYSLADEYNEVYDPYEKLNRKIFAFNSFMDYIILRPLALAYKNVTNDYMKARVGSFLENINVPLTAVNYGLQMNYNQTMMSIWRFIINSTFGVCGLFDVASKAGLTSQPQTFGNTLAYYGVGPGPYLVIPLIGSSNGRDFTDILITNNALNPIKYKMHRDFKLAVTGARAIHEREKLLPFTDHITKTSTDPYIAIRSALHQNRESKVQYPTGYKTPKVPN